MKKNEEMKIIGTIKRHFEHTFFNFLMASFVLFVLGLAYNNNVIMALGMFSFMMFCFIPFRLINELNKLNQCETFTNEKASTGDDCLIALYEHEVQNIKAKAICQFGYDLSHETGDKNWELQAKIYADRLIDE